MNVDAIVRTGLVKSAALVLIIAALVFRAKASDIRTQQEARVQAAQRALDIANLRYISGLGTYLDVLDAQRQLFSAQVDLAGTTRDQLTAVVQIYKAPGGGWEGRGGMGGRQMQNCWSPWAWGGTGAAHP